MVALNKLTPTYGGGGIGNVVPTFRKDGRVGVELVINNRDKIKNVIIPFTPGSPRSVKKHNQFNDWIKEHFDSRSFGALLFSKKNRRFLFTGFVDGDGSFFISSLRELSTNVDIMYELHLI
jgi:hypothetical protein